MRSVTAILLILSVVTRAHAAGPPTQHSLGGSERIGRLFDGAQTRVTGDGFLLGAFDADPAMDVLLGGNALTLWAATADGRFVQDGTFPLTEAFAPLRVAKMNDDPYPDLVGSTASGFAILDGTASGFATSPRHPAGAPSPWAVIGDMDGDGLDDAVSSGNESVTVFINHGNSFETVTSPGGPYSWGVGSVGDLDGDGDLDAIGSGLGPTHHSPFIRSYRNVGGGALIPWNDYPIPTYDYAIPTYVDRFVIADVDDDGHPDVAAVGSRPYIFWNDGKGGFKERLDLAPFTYQGEGLVVADMDANGRKDIVTVATSSEGTWARIHSGSGSRDVESGPAMFTGEFVRPFQGFGVGDVDGDDVLDLMVFQEAYGANQIVLFRGRSHSMPGQRAFPVGLAGIARAWAVDFQDLSRSSVLVVSPDSALYFESRGDGMLQRPVPLPVAAGSTPVDFTGDGQDDLIRDGNEEVIVRRCLGGLSFSEPETLRVGDYKLTADFDGDGVADLLTASAGAFHVVPGLGEGSFGAPGPDLTPTHSYVYTLAAADLDGDGAAEVATTERDEMDQDHLMVYRNDGAKGFVQWHDTSISNPYDIWPRRVSFLNFDDDGIPDISVGYSDTDGEVIYVGRGLGGGEFTFVDTVDAGLGEDIKTVFTDLDQDGFDEAVVTSMSSSWDGYLMIWANEAGRYAKEPLLIDLGGRPSPTSVGDFDGNGSPDLVMAVHHPGTCEHVMIHLNRLLDAPVPVLASLAASSVTSGRVHVEWSVGAARGTAYLERSEASNPWIRIASGLIHEASIAFEDRDVVPGREYSYRLALYTAEGDYTTLPFTARIPIPALSLRATNGKDARRLGFTLSTIGLEPVEITVHDLQGRRVASHRHSPRAPGETADIALSTPTPLRSGVYWVTATQGASRISVRVLRLF